jgi:NhaA family Na+:H+ antiporter
MATDIAFALGVLGLVGRGLPVGLRTTLLALAIVDDIGAVIVIAIVYADRISTGILAMDVALILTILLLRRMTVRAPAAYWLLGIAVWYLTWRSGVHATIAGVVLGLITPATPFQPPANVSLEAHRIADETDDHPEPPDADAAEWLSLARLSRQAVSPATWLESLLHPWSSFFVLPIFALANAGVRLTGDSIRAAFSTRVAVGIVAGLLVGKFVGISLGCVAGVRAGVTRLPRGVAWGDIGGMAALAGIGFTVALFITSLAFEDRATQDAAKVAILAASVLAALIGSAILIVRRRTGDTQRARPDDSGAGDGRA